MTSLSFGNPSVGRIGICQSGEEPDCFPGGGGTIDTSGGGFDWAALIAAIAAGGNATAQIIRANQYPYPYGNPYSTYPGGVTPQLLAQMQGQYGGGQYSGSFGLGGNTMMIMMLGLVAVMMLSMRR